MRVSCTLAANILLQHGLQRGELWINPAQLGPACLCPTAQLGQIPGEFRPQADAVFALPVEVGQRGATELGVVFEANETKQVVARDQIAARREVSCVQTGNVCSCCQPLLHPMIGAHGVRAGRSVSKDCQPEQRGSIQCTISQIGFYLGESGGKFCVHGRVLADEKLVRGMSGYCSGAHECCQLKSVQVAWLAGADAGIIAVLRSNAACTAQESQPACLSTI